MSKSSLDSIDSQHIQMKQEIEDENEIDEKKPLPYIPCTSAIKCEYDPDCGCPPCRFNANTKVKSEEQIKQEIKLEIKLEENYNKVKIETELTRKCVKDEFEDGECGCNECIGQCPGVVESTQSDQEQPQGNSPDQEQNEQPTSTEPIDNHDSSDYINDCPTPDYLPPFFSEDEDEEDEDDDEDSANSELDYQAAKDEQNDTDNNTNRINLDRSSRTVNKSKQKYQEEFSESDNDNEFELSDDENSNDQRSSESNSDEEEVDTEEIHKKERPFKCDHCKRSFLCKQDLKDHQAKVHQIGKCYQYKCKWYKCKYFMNDRRNAMQHIVRAHFKKGDLRDPIDFLHKIAITKKSMIKKDRRKLTIILRLNCPKCHEHFPNKEQLNIHLWRSHQIKQYRCVVRGCSASFKNKFRYHAHKKKVHRNVHVWQCNYCVHETMTYEFLLMHTIGVHEEGHFRCAVPGCGFLSRTNRAEMGRHHQINHRARKGESCYRNGLQMFSSDWSLGETQPNRQADEGERIDYDSHTSRLNSGRSSLTVNKSKRKYQEEFSESDNDSDFEPSDDDEKDAEEFTESDSEIGVRSFKESEKPKEPIKSTRKKYKKSQSNKSSSDDDTDNDDGDGETRKVTRKNNNKELALRILTLHLNCWKCDRTYKDYKALNKHLRKRHQIRKMRCLVRDCGESFNSGPKLSRHYQIKHSDNNLPCWQCDMKLANSNKLNYHMWKMHQKGHFKCSHEGCQFETDRTRSVVINHYKFEHSDKSTFKCPFKGCGMAFPNQFNLKVHSTVHKKEKSFKCEHCESVYTTSGMLIKHLAREHQIGKMIQYKCEWSKCGSIFSHVQNVYAHIRKLHFKDGEKRHPKEFVFKFETNEKPVTKRDKSSKTIIILRLNCSVDRCSKHFPDKDQLNIHLSECHQIEKFRCVARGCSASFQNCLHFTAHKNEVHGKMKVWHCDQCNYKGNTYTLLATHKGLYHEKGHFSCGHSECKFVSRTYRSELMIHRNNNHKRID